MKQVQGLWNGASVEEVRDDFNIFNAHGASSAAYLAQKENYALPVRTYPELGVDSVSSIIGGFTKVNEVGEGAALQLVLRPAPRGVKAKIHGYISQLKKGEPLKHVFGHEFPFSFDTVSRALNPKKEEEEVKKEKIIDEEAIKIFEAKITKPLFEVNVRVVASAGSKFQSDDIVDGITAGFSQFGAPRRNEFRVVKQKNPDKLIHQFIFRSFESGQKMILSSEEIASFCHFPGSSTETPKENFFYSK